MLSVLAGCNGGHAVSKRSTTPSRGPGSASVPALQPSRNAAAGIHKIEHVVVIMQENRSFDTYFGTFPGADGLPSKLCVRIGGVATAARGRLWTMRT
jgi:phospholipase C